MNSFLAGDETAQLRSEGKKQSSLVCRTFAAPGDDCHSDDESGVRSEFYWVLDESLHVYIYTAVK